MIPNIQPSPVGTPQGWSPNALAPSAAALSVDIAAAFEVMRLALVPGFVYMEQRDLIQAEVIALATTPQQIIAAPGPQLAVVPIYTEFLYQGGTAFATAGNIFIRYAGYPAVSISDTNVPAAINANRRAVLTFPGLGNTFQIVPPATPPINTAVMIHSSIDWTGAGVVQSCRVRVAYVLLSCPTSY